jgi:CRISPR-associated protein Cas1
VVDPRSIPLAATTTAANVPDVTALPEVVDAIPVVRRRRGRPPTDPLNALLSLGYTSLLTRATARAEARGYEIYLGGLQEYRAGRPSLPCDLIEPLRVPAVDRWVLSVCGRSELTPERFTQEEGGGFRLQQGLFGRTLHSWETYWANAGLEQELETWLDRLDACLRRWNPPPQSDEQSPDGL